MGQIANQMLLDALFRLKEKLKIRREEKRSKAQQTDEKPS